MSNPLAPETGDHSRRAIVAEYARKCYKSFQHCLDSASKVDKASRPGTQMSLIRVEDQLARFQLWTANICVFSSGRDSLDYRLREAPDVRTPVIGLLQALDFRVKTCSSILGSMLRGPEITSIEESVGKFVDSLDRLSSEITLLHRITNTIRRASKDIHNSRAANGFKIRAVGGQDAGPFLQQVFLHYLTDRFPGANSIIQERLAESMVLRCKRMLYRRERYGNNPIQLPQIEPAPRISHPVPDVIIPLYNAERPAKKRKMAVAAQSVVYSTATATTLSPERFRKAAAPSAVSKTVEISDNDGDVFPPAPIRTLMQRFKKRKQSIEDRHMKKLSAITGYDDGAELSAKRTRDGALAKAWNDCLDAVGEVTCPYCFQMLPVREAVDDLKWKHHVMNDLEPYVCLFEACQTPGHLYTHSSTWIKHMKEHALRWRCTSRRHGEFVTDSRERYLDHMKNVHSGAITDAQLEVLADQNCCMTGPLFKACPLCGEETPSTSLTEHLVGHMRSLARKSLPSHQWRTYQ
ncbi:hypothetical protein FVEG_08333 [Fusarium verticillioides 7600]|uniref:Oxidoreductase acuF-like C2H2 type zinc-finger domain-containing protein n=1 Tax=Gibberella moniliformis (strain M3125 / FGSC 7600) TaxID=334819 RepID=W7MLH9_GIBM7|nr:hypothetical protein FVEG_08333 [Fusarium verticillioides 7600]EWG48629.1 hypothetical protein FVEG_08333 [Fusarium verticillioides 7600]